LSNPLARAVENGRMSDRVLVTVPGLGVLALEVEVLRAALAEGARLCASGATAAAQAVPSDSAPVLVDAVELGRLTSTPASWWLAAARESDCPSTWVGKLRRFNVQECLRWLSRVQERDGNGRARRCAVAPRSRA